MSGLSSAAGAAARASISQDSSTRNTITIDGVIIDVTVIIEAGNVIVDPLVFDLNGDGIIDENDEIFDQLRLWVEKSEDGVCEAWETMSLREAGITSINLGYDNVREDGGNGNLVGQVGSFTRNDGSAGLAADVWFQELAMRPEGF